jgi:hypothetical protein
MQSTGVRIHVDEKVGINPFQTSHCLTETKDQIQRELVKLEEYTKTLVSEFVQKKEAIAKLEQDNKRHIEETAQNAYKALEDVVNVLLTVESGTRRLSRENSAIIATLNASVEQFGALGETSRKNTSELGVTASQCMSLGDGAATFITNITSWIDAFNADYKPMKESSDNNGNDYRTYRDREGGLRSQLNSAESERNVRQTLNFYLKSTYADLSFL